MTDPLKAVHAIHYHVNAARNIADAMDMLGMRAGEDLHLTLDKIAALAKEAADGIYRETDERYHEAMESTDRVMAAMLVAAMDVKPSA